MGTKEGILACADALAAAAQVAYDAWEQDEDGFDAELGEGGACDLVAERMLGVLAERFPDMTAVTDYVETDCHTVILARAEDGVLRIDIPARTYETGTGYRWRKIPGVTLAAGDVRVDVLSADPGDFHVFAPDDEYRP